MEAFRGKKQEEIFSNVSVSSVFHSQGRHFTVAWECGEGRKTESKEETLL